MTDKFEDMPDGAGKKATDEDYKRVWLYMKSRNKKPSVRSICEELEAQNYVPPSTASSARMAKRLGLSKPLVASETKDIDKRKNDRKAKQRERAGEPTAAKLAEQAGKTVQAVEITLKARMTELLKDTNSSTQLAITENRTRMAFNVALMEFYADHPGLLAGVRDAAAFLDATTIAAKLSGGPSIDITLPQNGDVTTDGISPNGHPMKTLGPPLANVDTSLVDKFSAFKARLRDGERA